MTWRRDCLYLFLVCLLASGPTVNCLATESPFSQVSAIFARHCVRCHNDIDREGDFSLESEASLLESGFVEAGGRSSHLLKVIASTEGDPPTMPKEADPLRESDVDQIADWIESGADWPDNVRIEEHVSDFDWWSFKKIVRPDVPSTDSWNGNPIDAFVQRKLTEKGLRHSGPADRQTMIRRLTYDLTGLPPTPDEVRSFLADDGPDAYEKLVGRLLDSRHYGERWARHWLDVVKYADTCGYDKDKLRPNAWPYRDYVIRSFNEDKPYGRFVQEQVAGDVLFPGEPDGVLGLGFIAAGPWDFIGHVEVPEAKIDGKVARNLDRDEMVSNTLNTFCSVTIQCARCHNHKFDPFTQEHYYGLQAIFSAVDRAERPYDLDPEIEKRRRSLTRQLKDARTKQQELKSEIAAAGGAPLASLVKRIESLRKKQSTKKDAAFGYHSAIVSAQDQAKWVQIDLGRDVALEKVILHPCHDDFAGIGAGFGFPIRFRVEMSTGGFVEDDFKAGIATRVHEQSDADLANPGLEPLVLDVGGKSYRFIRVTATKLAQRSNDYIFAMAELEAIDKSGKNVAEASRVTSLDSIEAPTRWARQNLVDGKWARPGDPEASRQLAEAESQRAEIHSRIFTAERKSREKQLADDIAAKQKQLNSLPTGKMVYAAATEFKTQGNFKPTGGKPRPVFLLHRGNVQQPKQAVSPRTLPLSSSDEQVMSVDSIESDRRAELARWLTSKDNPLVWRSIVNRVWQHHFGQGLVETPNDFGRMGALPTHPELLDWLACEFRDGRQSFKQLHRLIVTSSVYRQSSRHDEQNAAIDSGNRYLWRMSRRRLEAEEIRDSILAVSGKLDPTMGGPGFYLFKLEKTTHSPHYEYHKFDPADPASHRRSVYRFIVRSQPDPYMTTLDCADSSQSTPKRVETLTSLQALSLLNNRFHLEMAARFADRLAETGDTSAQIDRAMMLIVGRQPTDPERAELSAYADEHGMKNLCRMMFNFSEFLFLD